MGDQLINSTTTVLLAIVSLAVVAALVSKNANTSQVIQSGASGFSTALGTALSPITGSSLNLSGTYSGAGFMS